MAVVISHFGTFTVAAEQEFPCFNTIWLEFEYFFVYKNLGHHPGGAGIPDRSAKTRLRAKRKAQSAKRGFAQPTRRLYTFQRTQPRRKIFFVVLTKLFM